VADVELLTTSQVLTLLQIGRTKLWELVRGEAFPAYRIGEGRNSSLRYRRTDVLRWLERNRVNGASVAAQAEPESQTSRAR
jgi:predicted DNA-binding transcriptional regulator AlpA